MSSYFGQIESVYIKLALEKVFTRDVLSRDVLYVLSFQYLPYAEDCHSGLRGKQPLGYLLFQWRIQRVPGNRIPLKNRILVWNQYF